MISTELDIKQGWSLEDKIVYTEDRIVSWYKHFEGRVYVSFSGGRDSTVLLHLVRELYPEVPAVFIDTGLEYPEVRQFVKTIENVTFLKPKMNFRQVLQKYGYPIISKEQAKYIREVQRGTTTYMENKRRGKVLGRNNRPVGSVSKKWQYLMDQQDVQISERCCDVLKKNPIRVYEKDSNRVSYVGTMAGDSKLRKQSAEKYGCNAYSLKNPQSRPLSCWREEDILNYISKHSIPISTIYSMGYEHTGCVFCMFGVHLDKGDNRFQRLKKTHPKLHSYCINKLGCGKALDLIKVPY